MAFAQAFPEFDFHRAKRPAINTLCEFLQKACELHPNHSPLIERIVSYDAAVRPAGDDYHQVILNLIKYLNPGLENISWDDPDGILKGSLKIPENLKLIAKPGGSGECVLRYLNLRSLTIDCPGKFDIHQLHGLNIQTLDLTRVQDFTIEIPLSLPSLETIVIDPQNTQERELSAMIQSKGSFEILK